ncbi:hypothetical protein [Aureimonas pseudogalii]|uniref:Uncharacterized protein n=1 Tax=Aureimonas pseudogalii TaxID=1744844 RepID=A0A7W6EES6_9HYPH|nr:hypothetical protein [Aureimonas pseudogalii]MBB3996913.1 hypothetical protein [Aureimonas pseudogalii]
MDRRPDETTDDYHARLCEAAGNPGVLTFVPTMIVLHVTTVEFNDRGKRNWMLFEVAATDMKTVVDRLNNGDLVFGYALRVKRDFDDPSVRIVTNVEETTLHRDEVHRIQTPLFRIVRYEDEPEGAVA